MVELEPTSDKHDQCLACGSQINVHELRLARRAESNRNTLPICLVCCKILVTIIEAKLK